MGESTEVPFLTHSVYMLSVKYVNYILQWMMRAAARPKLRISPLYSCFAPLLD
jgi:hypothetical protein